MRRDSFHNNNNNNNNNNDREAILAQGREALELIRRQNIIYAMYSTPNFQSILEKK